MIRLIKSESVKDKNGYSRVSYTIVDDIAETRTIRANTIPEAILQLNENGLLYDKSFFYKTSKHEKTTILTIPEGISIQKIEEYIKDNFPELLV